MDDRLGELLARLTSEAIGRVGPWHDAVVLLADTDLDTWSTASRCDEMGVRGAAAATVALRIPPVPQALLLPILSDDPPVRRELARALSISPDAATAGVVRAPTADKDERVRAGVVLAASRIPECQKAAVGL